MPSMIIIFYQTNTGLYFYIRIMTKPCNTKFGGRFWLKCIVLQTFFHTHMYFE